jgi:hypothetical protein
MNIIDGFLREYFGTSLPSFKIVDMYMNLNYDMKYHPLKVCVEVWVGLFLVWCVWKLLKKVFKGV